VVEAPGGRAQAEGSHPTAACSTAPSRCSARARCSRRRWRRCALRGGRVSKATHLLPLPERAVELLEAVALRVYGQAATPGFRASRGCVHSWIATLGGQHRPDTRLLWEIGDVLSVGWAGPAPKRSAYHHLIDHLGLRLEEEGPPAGVKRRRWPGCSRRRPCSSPAAVAFGQADEAEVARFHEPLDALLAPHRDAA